MPTDSLPSFGLISPRSLLIWAGFEVVITIAWLLWHNSLPIRWSALVRLLRFTAIPYMALITGQISSTRIGLEGFDWQGSFTLGGMLVAVISMIWVGIRVSVQETALNHEPVSERSNTSGISIWVERGLTFVLCGGLELNWSFWRATFAYLIGLVLFETKSFTYWGVTIAVIYALPETLLTAPTAMTKLTNLAILFATSVIFLFTGNFWLCWAMHVILRFMALPTDGD